MFLSATSVLSSGSLFVRTSIKEKRMKSLRILLSLLLVASGLSAFAQKVTTDYDHSANFQAFHTYAWTTGTPLKNSLWDQRVTDGVDKRLQAKGFQKVSPDANPDMIVLYHAAIGQQAQLNTMNTGGYGWGYRWGGGMGTSTTTVEQIPVGQLTVDIGDAKTKKLLWQGRSSDTLSDKPDANQKKLNKALDKMFQKFPPPAAK
jgi:hypothetical protein